MEIETTYVAPMYGRRYDRDELIEWLLDLGDLTFENGAGLMYEVEIVNGLPRIVARVVEPLVY